MAVGAPVEQVPRPLPGELAGSAELSSLGACKERFLKTTIRKGKARRCRDNASTCFPLFVLGSVAALLLIMHSCFLKIGRGRLTSRRLSASRFPEFCFAEASAASLNEEVDDFFPAHPFFSAEESDSSSWETFHFGTILLFHGLRTSFAACESLMRVIAQCPRMAGKAFPLLFNFMNKNAEIMDTNWSTSNILNSEMRLLLRHMSDSFKAHVTAFTPVVSYAYPDFKGLLSQISRKTDDFWRSCVWTTEMQRRLEVLEYFGNRKVQPDAHTRGGLRELQSFQRHLSLPFTVLLKRERNSEFRNLWPIRTANHDPDLSAQVHPLTHHARLGALNVALLNFLGCAVSAMSSADAYIGEMPALITAAFTLSLQCFSAFQTREVQSEVRDPRLLDALLSLTDLAIVEVGNLEARRAALRRVEEAWWFSHTSRSNTNPVSALQRLRLHYAAEGVSDVPSSQEAAIHAVVLFRDTVKAELAKHQRFSSDGLGLWPQRMSEEALVVSAECQRIVARALYAFSIAAGLLDFAILKSRKHSSQLGHEYMLLTIRFLWDWIDTRLDADAAVNEPLQNDLRMTPYLERTVFEEQVRGAVALTRYSENPATQHRIEASNRRDEMWECVNRVASALRSRVQRLSIDKTIEARLRSRRPYPE